MVPAKSEGYCVPGVETKESARLSTGEFSNLIFGVDIVNMVVTPSLASWRGLLQCMTVRIAFCRSVHVWAGDAHAGLDRWPFGEGDAATESRAGTKGRQQNT